MENQRSDIRLVSLRVHQEAMVIKWFFIYHEASGLKYRYQIV